MSRKPSYRQVLREIAVDNYGFVTTWQAVEAGVPAIELPKLAARGGLENVAYGLYRVTDVPVSAFDQFAEALLCGGKGAYLYADTVLALLELAEVNPRTLRIAVNRRARPKLPPYIELVHVQAGERTTRYEGLEAQPVAEAILASRGRIETERLREAAKQARAEGLLTMTERRRVGEALRP